MNSRTNAPYSPRDAERLSTYRPSFISFFSRRIAGSSAASFTPAVRYAANFARTPFFSNCCRRRGLNCWLAPVVCLFLTQDTGAVSWAHRASPFRRSSKQLANPQTVAWSRCRCSSFNHRRLARLLTLPLKIPAPAATKRHKRRPTQPHNTPVLNNSLVPLTLHTGWMLICHSLSQSISSTRMQPSNDLPTTTLPHLPTALPQRGIHYGRHMQMTTFTTLGPVHPPPPPFLGWLVCADRGERAPNRLIAVARPLLKLLIAANLQTLKHLRLGCGPVLSTSAIS